MIRLILVVISIALYLIVFSPMLVVLWIYRDINREKADLIAQAMLRRICRIVIFLAGIKLTVKGFENIPKDQSVLFVSNHRSYFDIIVTLAQKSGRFGYVAKLELGRIPFLRKWMNRINCVFLDRDDIRAGLKVITTAIDNVKQGISVFIFPEGTRYHDDYVHDFKGGSFKIATRTNCPIIPVSVDRADDVFENHVPFVKSTRVTLTYGKPINLSELSKEDKKGIAEYTRKIVENQLKTP